MILDKKAIALPYRFTSGEAAQIAARLEDPLLRAYLSSILHGVLDLASPDASMSGEDIRAAAAYLAGQTYTLRCLMSPDITVPLEEEVTNYV